MGHYSPTTDRTPIEQRIEKLRCNERTIAYIMEMRELCRKHGYTRSLTIEAMYSSLLAWDDGDSVFQSFRKNVSNLNLEEQRREFLSTCTHVEGPESYRGVLFVSDPVYEVFETAQRLAELRPDPRIDPIDVMVVLLAPANGSRKPIWWFGSFQEREGPRLRTEFSSSLRLHSKEAATPIWLNLLESTAPLMRVPVGSMIHSRREANEDELCLNVDAYAGAVAQLLRDAAEEDDFVLAIYGPWGRGKTTLMRRVKAILGSPKCSDGDGDHQEYAFVDFSAWKYPTRPEVWIHLYEQITLRATKRSRKAKTDKKVKISSDKAEKNDSPELNLPQESFWQRSRLAFRMGLLRNGWPPLLLGLILLFVTRLPLDQALEWLRVGLGTIGLLLLVLFTFSAISLGHRVRMRYLSLPDHSEGLGMQAVIGRDLANLLKVWIDPSKKKDTAMTSQDEIQKRINFQWLGKGFQGSLTTTLLIIATFAVVAIRIPRPSQQSSLVTSTDLLAVSGHAATIANASGSFQEAPSVAEIAADVAPPINPVDINIIPPNIVVERPPSTVAYCTSQTILALIALALVIFVCGLSLPLKQHRKLLLIIDDLDRCEPDQMLAVIESLRLFLDNPEMSWRLQVIMLVDQRFLGSALLRRAAVNGLTLNPEDDSRVRYVREQREKFFVAELGLPRISPENLSDMVDRHLKDNHVELDTLDMKRKSKRNPPVFATPEYFEDTDSGEVALGTLEQNPDNSDESQNSERAAEVESADVRRPETDLTTVSESADQPESLLVKQPLKFSKGERTLLQSAIAKLHSREPTPRQVRASVVRYQLARLLLQHLGKPVTEESIPKVLEAIRSQMDGANQSGGNSLIDEVAHSVVCPDIAYSGESVIIPSASTSA